MIKNKKAQIAGKKVLFYIIFAVVAATTAMILISITITDASEINRVPPGLEEYIIINRFLYSPDCFAYKDETIGRAYPLIEWSNFTNNNLRYCYNLNSTIVKGFELTLTIKNEKKEKEEKTILTANWEGILRKKTVKRVLVLKDGKLYNGELTIGIQDKLKSDVNLEDILKKGDAGGGGAGGVYEKE